MGITGFVTRAEAGLRPPVSVSKNLNTSSGGVAIHWAGGGVGQLTHRQALETWRSFQAHHVQGNGWSDIAYNFGVSQQGYVFAGRGLGVRSAANGTNEANDAYYAAVWLGGVGDGKPSQEALAAFEWVISTCRNAGAGPRVRPHSDFRGTECPGPVLTGMCKIWEGEIATPVKLRPPVVVHALQKAVGLTGSARDGKWGPRTDAALVAARTAGPVVVKAIQRALGVTDDGRWGPVTDHAFRAARAAYLGRY